MLQEAGWVDGIPVNRRRRLSERYDRALILSAVAHAGTDRKETSIPYSTHPVHVARLLDSLGVEENLVIAGLLHDVLEDVKSEDPSVRCRFREVYSGAASWPDDPDRFRARVRQQIEEEFGAGVVKLVEAVSEQKTVDGEKRPWKVRKVEQLEHLAEATPAVAILKCADALHNVSSIVRDMRDGTPEAARGVLGRFNACPDDVLWSYGTVAAVCRERVLPQHLHFAQELEDAVRQFEKEVDRACGERDSFTGERPLLPDRKSEAIVLLSRLGRRIYSLDQWRRFAPPARGDAQWKDLRSAKELARAWFTGLEPEVPSECADLFNTFAGTAGLRIRTIFAERQTPLDTRGPGRQHDLLAHGTAAGRRVVVGIEGKADESFGPAIGEYLGDADKKNEARRRDGRRLSGVPERIHELAVRVFGRTIDSELSALRYQLLHATAGTLFEAQEADIAVLMVQEFVSSACDRRRLEMNWNDLVQFCGAFGKQLSRSGVLTGPLASAGTAQLYVGKVTRALLIAGSDAPAPERRS